MEGVSVCGVELHSHKPSLTLTVKMRENGKKIIMRINESAART